MLIVGGFQFFSEVQCTDLSYLYEDENLEKGFELFLFSLIFTNNIMFVKVTGRDKYLLGGKAGLRGDGSLEVF